MDGPPAKHPEPSTPGRWLSLIGAGGNGAPLGQTLIHLAQMAAAEHHRQIEQPARRNRVCDLVPADHAACRAAAASPVEKQVNL